MASALDDGMAWMASALDDAMDGFDPRTTTVASAALMRPHGWWDPLTVSDPDPIPILRMPTQCWPHPFQCRPNVGLTVGGLDPLVLLRARARAWRQREGVSERLDVGSLCPLVLLRGGSVRASRSSCATAAAPSSPTRWASARRCR
eukprot:6806941-Prymnesium_polylepis.1